MNKLKYVGMDVHKATIVILVLNEHGQFEKQVIIKTTTEAIRDFFQTQDGTLHVIFEEGTQSSWLYQLIKPLVAEVVVCDKRQSPLSRFSVHDHNSPQGRVRNV
jgi:phenylpyruvate tautomerase PptA (4-oxalocrotonate tautomerase family)